MNRSNALNSTPTLMAEIANAEAERATKRKAGLRAARSGAWPEVVGLGAEVGSD